MVQNFSPRLIWLKPGSDLMLTSMSALDEIFLEEAEQVVAAGEVGAVVGDELAGAVG